MNKQELLPCPCCGAVAEIEFFSDSKDIATIYCPKCEIQTASRDDYTPLEKIVVSWNTRTDAALRVRVAELEEVIAQFTAGIGTIFTLSPIPERDQWKIFTPEADKRLEDTIRLEKNIRAALRGGE